MSTAVMTHRMDLDSATDTALNVARALQQLYAHLISTVGTLIERRTP
jgi:hypothetical protein